MTEQRIKEIFGVFDGPYQEESMYVSTGIEKTKQAINETIEEMITQTVVQIAQQKLGIAQKVFDIKTLEGTHEMLLNKKIP